jgi:hypothetical protein
MTVHMLVSGSLFRAPEQRTSQAGKSYVVATIKAAAAETQGLVARHGQDEVQQILSEAFARWRLE